ncbi:hypothetical protein CU098_013864, partial [Rhizopus stolonifer]
DFTLYHNISTPPSIKSTITQINICDALSISKIKTECNKGTYVCQKIIYSQNNTDFVAEVHNIVGISKKSKLKTELKAIEPKEDSSKSGYSYSLALSREGSDQSAMIILVCDTNQSRKPSEPSIVSYDNHVLTLEWKTVFACSAEKKSEKNPNNNHQNKSPKEGEEGKKEEKEEKEEGISAISLFFIIILILLAVYFVGGAIYNIKVYNAKGFDLIIHRVVDLICRFLARFSISRKRFGCLLG